MAYPWYSTGLMAAEASRTIGLKQDQHCHTGRMRYRLDCILPGGGKRTLFIPDGLPLEDAMDRAADFLVKQHASMLQRNGAIKLINRWYR